MNIEFNKDARLVINGVVFDIAPENELKVILEIAKIEKGAMLFRPLYKNQWESDLNAISQFLIEEIEKYQEVRQADCRGRISFFINIGFRLIG